ncbi:uracil-DNA glycosylase family protein [Campylobacter helveticus]|uniref:uracil-DNA glycosylase family protein n=1 Tax=Campylobacter helveticus TaxID=28898 RepID=UPI0024300EEF|nr:uracil-DNA glycosylase family protein [Campylobacter helveticus]
MIRSLHYLKAMGYHFSPQNISKINTIDDFKTLRNKVSVCTLCNFSKTRRKILMEERLKSCKLFILDTHASKNENENGILLQSKKGEFLVNSIEKTLNLSRDEFYFSYIFKCFSANKNDDFALHSCLPFLLNEIKLIKPKILLCLGEYALKSLGFKDFKTLRGELFAYENFFILASFDGEFLERNPSFKEEFFKDLKKIKGLL